MGTHKKGDAKKRKEKYAAQFAITDANRKRKLLKHMLKQPNDTLAQAKASKLGI